MLLKTIAAGETVTFQSNYVGAFIALFGQGSTDIQIDKVKVVPLGDGVLCDLDAAGVNAVGVNKLISSFANFQYNNVRIVTLADGVVPQKVTDITISNGGTDDVKVYMPVYGKATTYVRTVMQTILAQSQSTFMDFASLHLPQSSDDDTITVDYDDGANHTFGGSELMVMSSYFQDNQKATIMNDIGAIKKVTVIPAAEQIAYLTRYDAIGNF